ncbi:MAG: NADH-quinone oxidoreductase subunit L [Acidobacteria bacterium]|nr:NADH-quinone oxidoreductase subunit L [Acidobacteriota bacterium]
MAIGEYLWLVPLLPLVGAAINGFRAAYAKGEKSKTLTNGVALGSTLLSAIIASFAAWRYGLAKVPYEVVYWDWIPAGLGNVAGGLLGNFNVELGLQIDSLSITMMMVVTWIGFLIHVYATGYMGHEKGYTRFFAYLNLFMFMMLLLVLGNNYVVMFVGWEGVGLCSYLLIGFYYDKTFAADAGKKAFITNRIGDFGFLLGIFLLFNWFGTADYTKVFALAAHDPLRFEGVATLLCLCLFVGACGKSAQFPLYVWLPDAMAGPTPVSALIHAATMVTAGVYMVVRSNVLFRLSPEAMLVVACVGAFTAIFAATIGLAQNDIKKVLAYSTVSQLGYMFLAAGVGAYTAAIFHLMTHAFFKACLFLGAGSVIHGCSGEQDMRKMGGLGKYMPRTHVTMGIATVAIAGIPPLAGFFSKDEILASAFFKRFETLGEPWSWFPLVLFGVGMLAAMCTAFYMFRLYFMTFVGEYRGAAEAGHGAHAGHDAHGHDDHSQGHADDHGHYGGAPHESPWSMTGVLWILAVGSILAGLVGFPLALIGKHQPTYFQSWLEPILLPIGGHAFHFHEAELTMEVILIAASVAVAVIGIVIAYFFYKADPSWSKPKQLAAGAPKLYDVLLNKYYVDEIYGATVIRGTIVLSLILKWIDTNIVDGAVNGVRHVTVLIFGHGSNLVDKYVVDGAVNGVASGAKGSSTLLRRMQTGVVQNYALVMGAGVVLLAVVYLAFEVLGKMQG